MLVEGSCSLSFSVASNVSQNSLREHRLNLATDGTLGKPESQINALAREKEHAPPQLPRNCVANRSDLCLGVVDSWLGTKVGGDRKSVV